MKFGFHVSISGGISKAVLRAKELGCETFQIFSRNPRGWRYSPIPKDEIEAYKSDLLKSGIFPVAIHMPYLPNLASPDKKTYELSVSSLCEELKRANQIEAQFLVTHLGKAMGDDERKAVARVANAIEKALDFAKDTKILLENTAGQGTEVGYRLSQIGEIIDMVGKDERVGICFDTAHAFEAGYDIKSEDGLSKTISEIEERIGIERLYLIHLNDSKTPLGSRVDRHWHIGEGYIGKDGFYRIINYPLFKDLPAVMETPKKSKDDDLKNMKTVKMLRGF